MCSFPYNVKNKYYGMPGETLYTPVPCGTCYECKLSKVNEWVFRISKEIEISKSVHWVTLTYNSDNIPITKKGYLTLNKQDIQKFFKRLRKDNKEKIKYFIVGEYGGKTERPHYHAVIMNADNHNKIINAWSINGNELGNIHFGSVNGDSIAYTLKYMMKNKDERDGDRIPEFRLMSKGIGRNYLTKENIKYHKKDLNRNYITTKQGYKIKLPEYYKKKIYNEKERQRQRTVAKARGELLEEETYRTWREQYVEGGKSYEAWKHEKRAESLKKLNRKDSL